MTIESSQVTSYGYQESMAASEPRGTEREHRDAFREGGKGATYVVHTTTVVVYCTIRTACCTSWETCCSTCSLIADTSTVYTASTTINTMLHSLYSVRVLVPLGDRRHPFARVHIADQFSIGDLNGRGEFLINVPEKQGTFARGVCWFWLSACQDKYCCASIYYLYHSVVLRPDQLVSTC